MVPLFGQPVHKSAADETTSAGDENPHVNSSALSLGEKYRDAVRIGIIELVFPHAQLVEPASHFLFGMLLGIVRMVPIEVHHVVGLEIEGVIPEALQKGVINQSLHIMRSGGDAEDFDRPAERDRRV